MNFMASSKDVISDNIEDYIKTEIDDMDYDNAIKKDDRKFCEFFCDKLKNSQIILKTFYNYEPLKPKILRYYYFIFKSNKMIIIGVVIAQI